MVLWSLLPHDHGWSICLRLARRGHNRHGSRCSVALAAKRGRTAGFLRAPLVAKRRTRDRRSGQAPDTSFHEAPATRSDGGDQNNASASIRPDPEAEVPESSPVRRPSGSDELVPHVRAARSDWCDCPNCVRWLRAHPAGFLPMPTGAGGRAVRGDGSPGPQEESRTRSGRSLCSATQAFARQHGRTVSVGFSAPADCSGRPNGPSSGTAPMYCMSLSPNASRYACLAPSRSYSWLRTGAGLIIVGETAGQLRPTTLQLEPPCAGGVLAVRKIVTVSIVDSLSPPTHQGQRLGAQPYLRRVGHRVRCESVVADRAGVRQGEVDQVSIDCVLRAG